MSGVLHDIDVHGCQFTEYSHMGNTDHGQQDAYGQSQYKRQNKNLCRYAKTGKHIRQNVKNIIHQ